MGARCSQSEDSTCAKERARRELVANAKLRAANAADGTNPCGLGRQGACNPASASFTTHRFLSRAPQRALEAPRGALAAAQWVVREQRRRASRFGSSAGRHHRARAHGRCTLHGDTARRVPGCAPRALRRAQNILSDCIFSSFVIMRVYSLLVWQYYARSRCRQQPLRPRQRTLVLVELGACEVGALARAACAQVHDRRGASQS